MKLLSPATDLVPRLMLLLYGMKRRIFIASNSTKVLVLLTALQNIVILSIIVTVSADIESTNVVCPHNKIYDLSIFAIFSKTGFVLHDALIYSNFQTPVHK